LRRSRYTAISATVFSNQFHLAPTTAFTFDLVHGLGFAGTLAEIGVPQNEVPLALLMFNVGIETGQVMFVVAASLLLAFLHRIRDNSALTLARATPYVIGGVAAFWTIERTVGSFSS
jgi:hypothetical protein